MHKDSVLRSYIANTTLMTLISLTIIMLQYKNFGANGGYPPVELPPVALFGHRRWAKKVGGGTGVGTLSWFHKLPNAESCNTVQGF